MIQESKRIKEEFGLSSEKEAVREYALLNRQMMRFNYPLIADEIIDRLKIDQGRILDVGTGLGSLALEFAKRLSKAQVYGIDLSDDMLNQAKNEAKESSLSNAKFLSADAQRLKFEDGYFDLVVSFGVLHHLKDVRGAFLEIKRVLKNGGCAFIYDLRSKAPQDTVNEIAENLNNLQKKAFLESVKEALSLKFLEDIIKTINIKEYSLDTPKYSHSTIIKNKNTLRESKLLGRNFNDILVQVYFKK